MQFVPARTYLGGLERIRERIANGEPPQAYLPILSQIRPEMIKLCEEAIDFSAEFLRRWLPQGTLKNNPSKVNEIVEALVGGSRYKSHGQVIDHGEAIRLGLNVELIEPKSELWNLLWELYLRSIHFLNLSRNAAKLFEAEASSITLNIEAIPAMPRPTSPSQPLAPSPSQ